MGDGDLAYFLAVDAGGTKTECVLADETQVLARASCGSVKLMRVSEAEATERLRGLLVEVSKQAGVGLGEISRTCMGLAGLSIAAVRGWAERTLGEAVGGEVLLCGDEEIALDAAFEGGRGMLVISGTGSNVVGRTVDGETGEMVRFWAGGWGPVLGDEGSGYWIGLEAVRAGLWARDRGVPTGLLEAIEEAWGAGSLGELVEMGNGQPGPDFAALAPVVAKCAAGGDELAGAVLARAGAELAEQVALVELKLVEFGGAGGEVGLAYTGSVLEKIAPVREAMVEALRESAPAVRVLSGAVDSLAGALWRARGGQ